MLSLVSFIFIAIPSGDDHVSRHQVDIEALESHGAHVRITSEEPASNTESTPVGRRIASIYIPEEWVGGDDGLTPIDHIFSDAPDPKPVVYILGRPKISPEKLQKLEESLPTGSLQIRAPVVLGILSDGQQHQEGVFVAAVQRDSPAAEDGIKVGDFITKLDESEISDFDSIVAYMFKKKPGQTVVITVLRDEEPRQIAVKLKGWYLEKKKPQRTK